MLAVFAMVPVDNREYFVTESMIFVSCMYVAV